MIPGISLHVKAANDTNVLTVGKGVTEVVPDRKNMEKHGTIEYLLGHRSCLFLRRYIQCAFSGRKCFCYPQSSQGVFEVNCLHSTGSHWGMQAGLGYPNKVQEALGRSVMRLEKIKESLTMGKDWQGVVSNIWDILVAISAARSWCLLFTTREQRDDYPSICGSFVCISCRVWPGWLKDKFMKLAQDQGHHYPGKVVQDQVQVRQYETKYGVQRQEMLKQIDHRIQVGTCHKNGRNQVNKRCCSCVVAIIPSPDIFLMQVAQYYVETTRRF